MSDDIWEYAAQRFDPPKRKWATPGALAKELLASTVQTAALDIIDEALVELANTPDGRLIITMPPQEGKSTRVAKDFPTWLMTENPELRIVTASYGQGLANRNGRVIRNNLTVHPELGLRIAEDNGAVHEWTLSGHQGGVLSVGIGAGLTGRPADLLIIDDPIKDRKEADSELIRDNVWDWWTDSAATRLAPGAPVVVILTRWHEDDLAGRLTHKDREDGHLWKVINIPAQADHRPEEGEVDLLGREPGEFMASARRRSSEQWEAIKIRSGSRTWEALFQGNPSPPGGSIFKREWWQTYEQPQWLVDERGQHFPYGFDDTLMSWDMTFKDKDTSDFVVGQVWGRRGADAYLLDQVRGRMDFVATVAAFKQLVAKWPTVAAKLVEDKANGTAVIASLRHEIFGIVEEEPSGSKIARASAVAPLVEARGVVLPSAEIAPWIGDFIEEHAGFPTGKNDDQVDGTSQALNRLILQPFIFDSESMQAEEYDAVDRRGYYASPI